MPQEKEILAKRIIVMGDTGKSSIIQAIRPTSKDIHIEELQQLDRNFVYSSHIEKALLEKQRKASEIMVTIDMTQDPIKTIKAQAQELSRSVGNAKPITFICVKGDLLPEKFDELARVIDELDQKVFFANPTNPNDPGMRQIRQHLHCENARDLFIIKHQQILDKEQGACLGSLRKTHLNETWSLNDILKHAEGSDNRSRKVCFELGWMDKKGHLTDKAPDEVVKAHQENIDASKGSTAHLKSDIHNLKTDSPAETPGDTYHP